MELEAGWLLGQEQKPMISGQHSIQHTLVPANRHKCGCRIRIRICSVMSQGGYDDTCRCCFVKGPVHLHTNMPAGMCTRIPNQKCEKCVPMPWGLASHLSHNMNCPFFTQSRLQSAAACAGKHFAWRAQPLSSTVQNHGVFSL